MLKPQITRNIPNVENFLRHCNRQVYRSKHVILREGGDSDCR